MTTTTSSSAEREEQALIIWARQQNGIAQDYHNRAAELLVRYTEAGRPAQWEQYNISSAERYAQMSLYYCFNPRAAAGTLYNLLRAQAIQGKLDSASDTIRMFRDNFMSDHLRDAVLNGDPDFANLEGMSEFQELRDLYSLMKDDGLEPFYQEVRFGVLENGQLADTLTIGRSEAEEVLFRFENPTLHRLDNLVFDLTFHAPLALSGTGSALTSVQSTTHGRLSKDIYLIRHTLSIGSRERLQTRVELNSRGLKPGDYRVTAKYGAPSGFTLEHVVRLQVE